MRWGALAENATVVRHRLPGMNGSPTRCGKPNRNQASGGR
jgi:hypothetical protein